MRSLRSTPMKIVAAGKILKANDQGKVKISRIECRRDSTVSRAFSVAG